MEGVAAAHDVGVVHRDLKPDNIFVCIGASGRLDDPRVLDFGISKLDDGLAEQLTRSGVAMGTPYYMSIEQLNGQRDLDARVDVYAMGVILYEAISGATPYVADSISALAIRVLTTEPVHLGQLRPDLPPGLANVVMKAMAKRRDDRYRSMRQLIEALRPFLPRSAGLLVPEGQGRLLRTPNAARGAHRGQSSVHPANGLQPTPHALEANRLSDDDEVPLRRSTLGRNTGIVVLLVALAALVVFVVRQRSETSTTPVAVDPSPRALPDERGATQAPERAGAKERASAPQDGPVELSPPTRVDASLPRGATPPTEATARGERGTGSSARAGGESAGPAGKPRPSKKARTEAPKANATAKSPTPEGSAAAEPAATQPEPARPTAPPPPPPPPRTSAEGRAGKLGSDEF
jgi:serine/threonine-protein kinase